jgi:type VI secretion system secreted protein Hcp
MSKNLLIVGHYSYCFRTFQGEQLMPVPCHLSLIGEKQGKIEGSCDMVGREGTILAYSMAHNISIPHSPTDGLATGKRIHRPLCLLKEFDRSSPKLYQALCTGEHLKDVVLKWYRITKQGTEEHYFTHKLEDAIVVAIQPYMPITLPGYAHRSSNLSWHGNSGFTVAFCCK